LVVVYLTILDHPELDMDWKAPLKLRPYGAIQICLLLLLLLLLDWIGCDDHAPFLNW